MITIKSTREFEMMRQAGRIVGETLALLRRSAAPGVSTGELDALAEEFILKQGAIPGFKGLYGFPGTVCTSVNEEVVHGIPHRRRKLRNGDIISMDVGAIVEGYYGDAAITVPVGEVSDKVKHLLDVTHRSLWAGIEMVRPGNRVGDIGAAVQAIAEGAGYGVVRDYVGHGIGNKLHEEPQVPNYGTPGTGVVLKAGMAIAIEPMVNMGTFQTKTKSDKWTVVTADGGWSAHFEHTVLIHEGAPEVVTVASEEVPPPPFGESSLQSE
ncbi:MAG: type I methionyl aminopeptidase [Candidatus Sericytochromatia bacterium]|nr:type I methionyl aminopeptidase [Candidatus Sericytochromatia bacterium]